MRILPSLSFITWRLSAVIYHIYLRRLLHLFSARDICTMDYTELVNTIIYLNNVLIIKLIYLLSILGVLRI
jgi:hypothetical protein